MTTILITLSIALCLTLAYVISIKKQLLNNSKLGKINIDDYEQPEELFGTSKDKKTGKLYCTSRLIKNIKSPVITEEYRWKCSLKECNTCYYNQKNKYLYKKKSRVISKGITID